MRALVLLAGAALTLSACGGAGDAETEANAVDTLAVNNLIVEDNGMANATADLNATMNAVDANATNAVAEDLTTNEADANLANGL